MQDLIILTVSFTIIPIENITGQTGIAIVIIENIIIEVVGITPMQEGTFTDLVAEGIIKMVELR